MNTLKTVFLALVLILPCTVQAETFTFTAKNIHLKDDNLSVGTDIDFPVITSRSSYSLKRQYPNMTACFDEQQRPLDCPMLFDVGFIDEADITVTDGAVSKISITVIHQ